MMTSLFLSFSGVVALQFVMMRKLMDELEDEMTDISKEQVRKQSLLHNFTSFNLFSFFLFFLFFFFSIQKMLTDIVKKSMNAYRTTLKEKSKLEMDYDIANGFITRALQYHYEKNYFRITPSNVKVRMSEEELKAKL